MDTDKPTSENRTISSLCVLKRKLKHSRRAHIQKQATDTHHPLILEDQKQKLSSLAGKIKTVQQSPKKHTHQEKSKVEARKPVKLTLVT